ncbi:hypothetical protein GCM10022207_55880 [Streptomyces lannensis]|uniref:Uncharacterized protein n=1 Tax=Streptomyces lannensis TaxID=766498 RepID=A0ABP7KLH4_9ACTN
MPCDGGHQAGILANFRPPEGYSPDDVGVDETAGDRCRALEGSYAMDTVAVPADFDVYHVTPGRDIRASGDRFRHVLRPLGPGTAHFWKTARQSPPARLWALPRLRRCAPTTAPRAVTPVRTVERRCDDGERGEKVPA